MISYAVFCLKKKSDQTNKSNHLEPGTERGGSIGRKKTQEPKLPSLIRQETPQTLTLKFRKHQKQPKEKNPEKRKTVERGGGVKVN